MRLLLAALTLCALIGLAAPRAQASESVRFGIQDDSWLTHGAGTLDDRLDRLESLGVDIVRFNLHWDRIEAVRGEQNWEESDLVLSSRERPRPATAGSTSGSCGTSRTRRGGFARQHRPCTSASS